MVQSTCAHSRYPILLSEVRVFRKILVPLDGSDLAEAVLPYVTELAKRFDAQVVLLQVIDSFEKLVAEMMPATLEPSGGAAMVGVDVAEEQARAEREQAEAYLQHAVAGLASDAVNATAAVVDGNAGDEILRYAQENAVDLIAMSTHGRSGLSRLVYGSVTDAVLRASRCPVLVIRSTEEHRKSG
jgi:nucleotide-binding universal stress UspA family protein